MPWYYAGPEAKPVGPVSLEELQARRLGGMISPETYVIEHTGHPNEPRAWKRYREIFPSLPTNLPAIPPVPVVATALSQQPPVQPHPLFPSAAPVPTGASPFPLAPRPDLHYAARKTNPWCAWGFGLGLAGFIFSFACGVGFLLALPALFLCIMGMAQLHKHQNQAGRGMAIAGLVLSAFALLVALIFFTYFALGTIKAHGQTTTEQSSNDSQ